MKYACLGYLSDKHWNSMSKAEQEGFIEECLAYDEILIKNGNMVGGTALQNASNATTLRFKDGKLAITDGPFAETNEQLGGIMLLEARDLNHAIQLMAQHPSIRLGGTFEIRPTVEDPTANITK